MYKGSMKGFINISIKEFLNKNNHPNWFDSMGPVGFEPFYKVGPVLFVRIVNNRELNNINIK
jgi:hypothetical protein